MSAVSLPQPPDPRSRNRAEVARIADQLERAFAGEAWHGPSVTELVGSISSQDAAAKPVAGAHSIWEIVEHITVWKQVVHRRLMGEAFDPTAEQDWPAVTGAGANAWNETLRRLHGAQRQLREDLATMSDAQLGETVPGQEYSAYVMLHGAVQHDLYHAGQIALLKRALKPR